MKPIATMNGSRSAARIGGHDRVQERQRERDEEAGAGPLERDAGDQQRGDVDRRGQDGPQDQEPQEADPGRRRLPPHGLAIALCHGRILFAHARRRIIRFG